MSQRQTSHSLSLLTQQLQCSVHYVAGTVCVTQGRAPVQEQSWKGPHSAGINYLGGFWLFFMALG